MGDFSYIHMAFLLYKKGKGYQSGPTVIHTTCVSLPSHPFLATSGTIPPLLHLMIAWMLIDINTLWPHEFLLAEHFLLWQSRASLVYRMVSIAVIIDQIMCTSTFMVEYCRKRELSWQIQD